MSENSVAIPTNVKTAEITGLSHEGRGIARVDGKATFVTGALPGETVSLRYTRKHKQFDEAEVVEVLTAAPERITPRCAHFDRCGGCSLQHLSQEAQLQHKESAVFELLARVGGVVPAQRLTPIIGPAWGYRSKARLGVRFVSKRGMLVGFRERDTRFLADIKACEVLDPVIGHQLGLLREIIASLSCYQRVPQVEIAVSEDTTALIFRHLEPLTESDVAQLIAFGQTQQWHIYVQPKNAESIHRLWPHEGPLRLTYHLPTHNIVMQFHPVDFTQVNTVINQQMVDQALSLLDLQPTDHVLDLFCGIGNFTLPAARYSHKVVGVEGSETAVARARENAALNQIQNAQFYVGDLRESQSNSPWHDQRYDKLIIDPARSGAIECLPGILYWQPKRIVYISCNPATLARDAGKLLEYGYTCHSAGVMDMFPQTSHVEAMALFIKG